MARKTAIWLILIAFTLAYCSPENTAKADMAVKLKSKTLPSGSIAVVSMVTLLDRSVSKELLDYNSSVLQSVLSGMSRRNKIVDLSVLKGSLGKREYNRFLRDYKRSGVISSNWYRKIKESNPDLRYILLPTVESHGLSREYRDSEEANKKTAMYTVGIIVVIAAIVVAVALSKDKGGGKASGLLGKSKGGLRGGKPARRGYARARGGSKAGGWRKGRGGRPRSSRVKGHPGKHKGELKGGSSGKHRGKYKTPSTAGKQPGIARTAGGKGHPGRHIGESKGGAPGRHLGKYKGHSGKGSGPASAKVTGGSGKKPMPEAGVKGGSGATASGKTGAGKRWRGSRHPRAHVRGGGVLILYGYHGSGQGVADDRYGVNGDFPSTMREIYVRFQLFDLDREKLVDDRLLRGYAISYKDSDGDYKERYPMALPADLVFKKIFEKYASEVNRIMRR